MNQKSTQTPFWNGGEQAEGMENSSQQNSKAGSADGLFSLHFPPPPPSLKWLKKHERVIGKINTLNTINFSISVNNKTFPQTFKKKKKGFTDRINLSFFSDQTIFPSCSYGGGREGMRKGARARLRSTGCLQI